MTVKAVYPGTFDPITNGHKDLITRTAQIFDEVIIAVASAARKSPAFSLADRIALTEQALLGFDNVTVCPCEGLLVDFAAANQAQVIVRGLRAVSDFDYEFQLAGMNTAMAPNIETVFLPASSKHAFISSTMVREIVSLGGDVSAFVPKAVIDFLRK